MKQIRYSYEQTIKQILYITPTRKRLNKYITPTYEQTIKRLIHCSYLRAQIWKLLEREVSRELQVDRDKKEKHGKKEANCAIKNKGARRESIVKEESTIRRFVSWYCQRAIFPIDRYKVRRFSYCIDSSLCSPCKAKYNRFTYDIRGFRHRCPDIITWLLRNYAYRLK